MFSLVRLFLKKKTLKTLWGGISGPKLPPGTAASSLKKKPCSDECFPQRRQSCFSHRFLCRDHSGGFNLNTVFKGILEPQKLPWMSKARLLGTICRFFVGWIFCYVAFHREKAKEQQLKGQIAPAFLITHFCTFWEMCTLFRSLRNYPQDFLNVSSVSA